MILKNYKFNTVFPTTNSTVFLLYSSQLKILQGLDYRWVQTGTLKTESPVHVLSWNLEGTRLLTAGSLVQLWHLKSQPEEKSAPVRFTLGGGESTGDGSETPEDTDKPQGRERRKLNLKIVAIAVVIHNKL